MKKLTLIALASLLTAAMLTGCGWHLRGTGQSVSNISSVHISAQNRGSDLYRMLVRAIEANDIEIVENAPDAEYSIVTLNQKSLRRTATISSSARVSEYQLTEAIDVLILDAQGTQLVPRTTLSTERFFDFDENDVQSKSEESELLQREMRQDLVRQILNRLTAVSRRSSATETSASPADATAN